jgi:hypothetical protein
MAKSTGLAQQFFVHGYDLSGDVSSIDTASSPREVLEVPNLAKSAMERLLGRSDGSLDFSTWFDDAAGLEHAALKGLPTTDIIVLWALGSSVSDASAAMTAKQINYDGSRGNDGSLAFSVQTRATGGIPLHWGKMLSAGKITHANASSSSSRDDSASTSAGARAWLLMTDIDSGTPTVKIEDSTDDSSWADLIAFSAIANGNEPTAEYKTVTGTVNRYLRITTTGTFSNADFAVAIQRGTAQDDEDLS